MKTLNILAFLVLSATQFSCSTQEPCVESCAHGMRVRVYPYLNNTSFPTGSYRLELTVVEDGFTSVKECQIPSLKGDPKACMLNTFGDSMEFVFTDHAYFDKTLTYKLVVNGLKKRDEALSTIIFPTRNPDDVDCGDCMERVGVADIGP